MNKYKLYVWIDVLQDYSRGIAFSIAKTKKEAIDLLLTEWDEVTYANLNNIPHKSDFGTTYMTKDKQAFEKQLLDIDPIISNVGTPIGFFVLSTLLIIQIHSF